LAVKILVKKTMVIGLDIVRKKTERKLANKLADSISAPAECPLVAIPLIRSAPSIMRTIELTIPNTFSIFFFSSNFPIPTIERVMYK